MNNHEDKLRKSLDQNTPNWNEDLVWDKIEQELHPKRKNRLVLLFLIVAGAFSIKIAQATLFSESPYNNKQTEHTTIDDTRKGAVTNTSDTLYYKPNSDTDDLLSSAELPFESVSNLTDNDIIQTKSTLVLITRTTFPITTSSALKQPPINASTFLDSPASPAHNYLKPNTISTTSMPALNLLPSRQSLLSYNSRQAYLKELDNFTFGKNSVVITPSITDYQDKYSYMLRLGIFHTNRIISAISDESWIAAKNSQESILETIDLAVMIRRQFNSRFFVSTGIGISQTSELLTVTDSLITERTIQVDTATIINTDLSSHVIPGELIETTKQRRTTKTPNRLQSLYLPLNIGYLLRKNSWTLSLAVGTDLELSRRLQGKILDLDLSVISANSIESGYLNYSIGFANLNGSAGITYQMSPRLSFGLDASYKYGLIDYLESDDYTLRYNKVGLTVNLIYRN